MFEGPSDESSATLRRLKVAFISDLEFPIEEVQRVLSEAPPLTIYSSNSEETVTKYYQVLKSAGAKVLMIQPKADLAAAEESNASPSEVIFEFTDLPGIQAAPEPSQPKKTKRIYRIKESEEAGSTLTAAPQIAPEVVRTEKEAATQEGPLFPELVMQPPPLRKDSKELLFKPAPTHTEAVATEIHQALKTEQTVIKPRQSSVPFSLEDASKSLNAEPPAPADRATALSSTTLSLLEIEEGDFINNSAPLTTAQPQTPPPQSVSDDYDLSLSLDEPVIKHRPLFPSTEQVSDTQGILPSAPARSTIENQSTFDLAPEEPSLSSLHIADKPKLSAPQPPTTPTQQSEAQEEPEKISLKELIAAKQRDPASTHTLAPAAAPQITPPDAQNSDWTNTIAPAPVHRSHNPWREFIIPFGVGLVLLALGNWIYHTFFSNAAGNNTIQITPEMLTGMAQPEAAPHSPPGTPPAIAQSAVTPPLRYEYSRQDGLRSLRIAITLQVAGQEIRGSSADIAIELPAPPTITPEEIVQGKAPPLWLRRIEINLPPTKLAAESGFEVTTPTRFYIEQGKKHSRGVGKSMIRGKLAPDMKTLEVELVTFSGFDSPPKNETAISLTSPGRYRFAVREQLSMHQVNPPIAQP